MLGQWIKRQVFKQNPLTLQRVSFTTKTSTGIPVNTIPCSQRSAKGTMELLPAPKVNLAPIKTSVSPYTVVTPIETKVVAIKKNIPAYRLMPLDKWRDGILAAAAAHKYTITPALWEQLATFPSQLLCISHIPTKQIHDFSRVLTIVDCVRNNMPMESVILLAQNMFTTPGEGVAFTQNLMAHTRFFENLIPDEKQRRDMMSLDYTKLLSKEDLVTLPFFFLTNATQISIKTQNTLGYELWAMVQVNRHLVHNRLGVAFKKSSSWVDKDMRFDVVDPFTYEASLQHYYNYYDQTQNMHSDYVFILEQPVNAKGFVKPKKIGSSSNADDASSVIPPTQQPINHPRNWVAFDLKFGQIRPAFNTVKACQTDSELVKNLLSIHDSLTTYLEIKGSSYRLQDEFTAKKLVFALNRNVTNYKESKDISAFQATYHQLYDNHAHFFIKNQIGFNFLVNLPLSSLRILEKDVNFFRSRYVYHATARDSLVSIYSDILAKQNLNRITPGGTITGLVHEMFKNPVPK